MEGDIWVRLFNVDQTVVSVGPYKFQSVGTCWSNCVASVSGRASPPHNTLNLVGRVKSDSCNNIRHVEGVACMSETLWRIIKAANCCASAACACVASMICAPVNNGRNSSKMEISKEREVTLSKISSPVIPGSLLIEHRKLTTLLCSTMTPFGFPVEPEV
ncbi:hypothetical protein Xmir_04420 [Xenorhabdus miraniensis]|uniref:Uncharacterized protein n=1 Tax=Xenorhabdus miraniensis TaxID=351674 RepID=A0A2D0J7A8_9GAMM|nr:hypothetical protein Xmir_04420 [Xenorhabdus miraniensis]